MVERIPIADREAWLALRKVDVTASAAAALLGAHPYMTAYGMWAEKTGAVPEGEMTPAMERGLELEPLARRWVQRERPQWMLEVPQAYYRDPDARLGATPDLFARDETRGLGVIQIKNPEPHAFRRNWRGEEGEIEPPLYAVVQAIIEAHLTGAKWAAVAALVVGHGIDLHIIDVPLHAGIIERIRAEVAAFWRLVESGNTPDPDYGRDAEMLARVLAEAEEGSVLDMRNDNELPGLLAERAAIAQVTTANKKRGDEIRAQLLHKFGTAEKILVAGGIVSAKTVHRKAYSVEASSYRDIRFKTERASA